METKFDKYHQKVLSNITVIGHNVQSKTSVYKVSWKDGRVSTVIDKNIVSVLIKLDTEVDKPENIEKIEILDIKSIEGLILSTDDSNDIDVCNTYTKVNIYS